MASPAGDPGKDLIERARRGDRDAFDEIERCYRARIEKLIAARIGPRLAARTETADLAQECFLRAFESIRDFRGSSGEVLWSWLATIARHAVQEAGRRLSAKKAGTDREVPLDLVPAGSSADRAGEVCAGGLSPSGAACAGERFERLVQALGRLSPDHREIIRLARLQGLPLRECGRRLGRSEKAASVLLLRAMLKLRESFGVTESFHLPDRSLEEEAFGDAGGGE